jgi:hypothetical protein
MAAVLRGNDSGPFLSVLPDIASEKVYNRSVATRVHMRSRADIQRFFDGFNLVDPGLVYVPAWRPDSPADLPDDPAKYPGLVGVGRKP